MVCLAIARLTSVLLVSGLGTSPRCTMADDARDMMKVLNGLWRRIDAVDVSGVADGEEVWMLKVAELKSGRKILYRHGMIYGGSSFVGFDPVDRRIVLVMRNVTSWPSGEGVELVERLAGDGGRYAGR